MNSKLLADNYQIENGKHEKKENIKNPKFARATFKERQTIRDMLKNDENISFV